MVTNERYSDFALRLQTTYEAATPSEQRDVEVLKKQFLNCLPKKTARRFKLRMGHEKEGTRVRWKDVISWAKDEDEIEEQEDIETKETALPVWATLNEDRRMGPGPLTNRIQSSESRLNDYGRFRPQNFDREENRVESRNVTCNYCKKRGHIKRNCWKLNGWCLVCGSDRHKIADCDLRGKFNERNNQNRQTGNAEQSQRDYRRERKVENKCSLCDENTHALESCPVKQKFEIWLKEKEREVSGNETAPPLPGVCWSQQ